MQVQTDGTAANNYAPQEASLQIPSPRQNTLRRTNRPKVFQDPEKC